MYHPFSIAETIKATWNTLKKNFVPLVVYSAISLFIYEAADFLNAFIFIGDDTLSQVLTFFFQFIIQAYLTLSFYKLILTLIDSEYYEFEFRDILPSLRMTFNFLLIGVAYTILIGTLLFINKRIEMSIAEYDNTLTVFRIVELCLLLFLLLRSIFCVCFIVDDDSSPYESLKQSFGITKDNFFKTLALLVIIILYMAVVLLIIFIIFRLFGFDEDSNEYLQKLMFYCWFIFTFPVVQVMIMVTYRKLVYSHLDVDDDIAETN